MKYSIYLYLWHRMTQQMNFRPSEDFHSNYLAKQERNNSAPLIGENITEFLKVLDKEKTKPEFKIENNLKFRSARWRRITEILAQKHGGYICQLCLKNIISMEEITHDHIEPKSKGGKYALYNLQLAHKKCNSIKGNRTRQLSPEYFANYQPPIKKVKKVAFQPTTKKKIFQSEHDNPEYWKLVNEELKQEAKKTNTVQENHCALLWNEIINNKFQNLSYEMFHRRFELYAQQRIEALEKLKKQKLS